MGQVIDLEEYRRKIMIRIPYLRLNSGSFLDSLTFIAKARALNSHTAYKIGKIAAVLDQTMREISKEYKIKADDFLEKDEKGQPILSNETPNLGPHKVIAGKEEEMAKFLMDFLNQTTEINLPKINIRELGDMKLSAVDLQVLSPIFEDETQASVSPQTI